MSRADSGTAIPHTVAQADARDYIIDMSEELAGLAAKSGLFELESILRLAKLAAQPSSEPDPIAR